MSIERSEALELNHKLWNQIAPQFIAGTALPKYGAFFPTEDDLALIEDLEGKIVLELGCGSGRSLFYLKKSRNARELWGVDISPEQIRLAKELFNKENLPINLLVGSMDNDVGIPKSYFDCIVSIYGLGWTPDLPRTLSLVHDYLNPRGIFVFSWEHPVYKCLDYNKEIDGFFFQAHI
ncbi:class I SAM-dependent methyltransferase [Thermodesulfobacteriota bacterium]